MSSLPSMDFSGPSATAPSGTLLGLLQRGRGDGTLHALTSPRSEALAALNSCVLNDPRHDWHLENRSLYYARLFLDLRGTLDAVEGHLFAPEDVLDTDEQRTGLALSVLGHLAAYGRRDAVHLLRRYVTTGANWAWALDELALRDSEEALRALAGPVLARFPSTDEGRAELAATVRDTFEPLPWRLWAEDPRPGIGDRVRAAQEQGSFDRWQRQLSPAGPRPDWSVEAVFDWAEEGIVLGRPRYVAAARCLSAVAGPEDRSRILEVATLGGPGARSAALRYLADRRDPALLGLVEDAALAGDDCVAEAALTAFAQLSGGDCLERARRWAGRPDALGSAAGQVLAVRGTAADGPMVLAALREAFRSSGADAPVLGGLVDGCARLGVAVAAPQLREIYRETASSHLRGRAALALAATDPDFAASLAVECLWDCEESTREAGIRHAATVDHRVVDRLRRLAADPAEEDEVQTAVRSRIGRDHGAG